MRFLTLCVTLLIVSARSASADPITWRFDGHFDGERARAEYGPAITDHVTLWLTLPADATASLLFDNLATYSEWTYVLDLGGYVFTNYPNRSGRAYIFDNLPSSGRSDIFNPEIDNQRESSLGTLWDGRAFNYIYFTAAVPSDAIQDFRLSRTLDQDIASLVQLDFEPRFGRQEHGFITATFTHVAAVPEPSTLALSALGLSAAWAFRRKGSAS